MLERRKLHQGKIRSLITWDNLIVILSLIYAGWIIFFSTTIYTTPQRFGIIFLGLTIIIVALGGIKGRKRFLRNHTLNALLAVTFIIPTIVVTAHYYLNFNDLYIWRMAHNTGFDLAIIGVTIVIILYLAWWTYGKVIPIVVLVFIAYAFLGAWIPGFLGHNGISMQRFLEISGASFSGIYGNFTQLASTWVALFIFYACIIQGFGGLEYLIGLARKVVSKWQTMLPQTSVLASMFFGSLSGSAGANVAGTGSFTIPLMKRYSIPADYACAIESVASTGGQVMPPVMGVVAFVMADYLAISYFDIVKVGFLPALIFYASVALGVFFIGRKYVKAPIEAQEEVEEVQKLSGFRYHAQAIPIVLSLGALIYLLAVIQLTAFRAALAALVAFLCFRFIQDLILARGEPQWIVSFGRNVVQGFRIGTTTLAPMMIILASLSLIVEILNGTGLAAKLSYSMIDLSGGNFYLLLLLVMAVCILFGMAITTVGAYVIIVVLAAPALQQFGVPPLAAHFMVFYGAILSAITPPVAGIVVIASSIAKSNFLKSCWAAMRLSIPLFVFPFVFAISPQILDANGSAVLLAFRLLVGFLAMTYGVWASSSTVQGHLIRALAILCGVATVIGWESAVWIAGLAGVVIIATVLIVQYKWGALKTSELGKENVSHDKTLKKL